MIYILYSGFRVPLRGPGMTASSCALTYGSAGDFLGGWVYIMASARNGTLYVGVTSDLQGRAFEHKSAGVSGFTKTYGCKSLVWYERHDNIVEAISREKELKKFRRDWKLFLIEGFNPDWNDLYETCYERDNASEAIRIRANV